MIFVTLLFLCSAFHSTASSSVSSTQRKLFGVYVYAEQTLASSGYNNWDQLGCGVFTKPARTDGFIQWFLNPDNRIGQLKIDVVPLFKHFETSILLYDYIIHNATQAGIDVQFMESNSIPGDECANNCADTCKATGGGSDDSCTPSYMDYFHTMVSKLLTRYSDLSLSAVYDIEQTTSGNYEPVWTQIATKVSSYENDAIKINSKWKGYSFIRPAGYQFSGDLTMLGGSQNINFMKYFTPLDPTWNLTNGVIHEENGILDQIKFCSSNHCKVQIGFETSAEDPQCKTYQRCKSSFVWGGGLGGSESIIHWIENILEPALIDAGVNIENDLSTVPYFLEHQASAMAYFANVQKGNIFPASSCYAADADCITCCSDQKHHSLCKPTSSFQSSVLQ
jgi:hypothetical protein